MWTGSDPQTAPTYQIQSHSTVMLQHFAAPALDWLHVLLVHQLQSYMHALHPGTARSMQHTGLVWGIRNTQSMAPVWSTPPVTPAPDQSCTVNPTPVCRLVWNRQQVQYVPQTGTTHCVYQFQGVQGTCCMQHSHQIGPTLCAACAGSTAGWMLQLCVPIPACRPYFYNSCFRLNCKFYEQQPAYIFLYKIRELCVNNHFIFKHVPTEQEVKTH